jgi:DNA-binding response OmpR family regulator
MRILVVEDEPSLANVIAQVLAESGYVVALAQSCAKATEFLTNEEPSLMLLDLMLPDGNGLDLLVWFRRSSRAPVLILTARGGVGDRVHGLDEGADDYLVKPFRLDELLARVRALLRRSRSVDNVLIVGDFKLDFASRRVTYLGRVVFLSTTEYALLELLARSPGCVVSKGSILKHVWDDDGRVSNVVEVYINYLRHKLERGGAPRLIQTVRRHGYMFSEAATD